MLTNSFHDPINWKVRNYFIAALPPLYLSLIYRAFIGMIADRSTDLNAKEHNFDHPVSDWGVKSSYWIENIFCNIIHAARFARQIEITPRNAISFADSGGQGGWRGTAVRLFGQSHFLRVANLFPESLTR